MSKLWEKFLVADYIILYSELKSFHVVQIFEAALKELNFYSVRIVTSTVWEWLSNLPGKGSKFRIKA